MSAAAGGFSPLGGLPTTPPCRHIGSHQHGGLALPMEPQIHPHRCAAAADFLRRWCITGSRAAHDFSAWTWDLPGPRPCVPTRAHGGGYGGPSAGAETRLLRSGSLQAWLRKAHAGGSRESSREGRLPCAQLQKDSRFFFFLKTLSYFAPLKTTENLPHRCATSGKLGYC